jgi:monoamine oxidase
LAEYARAQAQFGELAAARAVGPVDTSFTDGVAGLRENPWTATLTNWEAMLIAAADPDDFSLRDWHDNELDDDNRVVEGGIGAFVARRLGPPAGQIICNAPVQRLDWSGGVAVHTPSRVWRARAAIVTVSTGVLAAGHIDFRPALPESVRAAVAGLPMGLLTKVAMRLRHDALPGLPHTFSLQRQLAHGEAGMFFNVRPRGADHVVGFVGGPMAWQLAREGAAAAEAFARAQWQASLGPGTDSVLGAAVVTQWGTDPNCLGAYAYARPGQSGARAVLGTPLDGGRLVFAGEAVCTDGLAGTVGGAWLNGWQAASGVAAALAGVHAA